MPAVPDPTPHRDAGTLRLRSPGQRLGEGSAYGTSMAKTAGHSATLRLQVIRGKTVVRGCFRLARRRHG
jgi:hypothetical protein